MTEKLTKARQGATGIALFEFMAFPPAVPAR
jgi:hypothetical protein